MFHDDAARLYFLKNYYQKQDPLIFDGTNFGYLDQINLVMQTEEFMNSNILDLGCGKGALYYWIMGKTDINSYLGVDFAIEDLAMTNNARIQNQHIKDVNWQDIPSNTIAVLVNTLCYLNNDIVETIFNARKQIARIIILDPVPGVFWDAHFAGVRLYYRTCGTVKRRLVKCGWRITNSSCDYAFKIRGKYIMPLSYAIAAESQPQA